MDYPRTRHNDSQENRSSAEATNPATEAIATLIARLRSGEVPSVEFDSSFFNEANPDQEFWLRASGLFN